MDEDQCCDGLRLSVSVSRDVLSSDAASCKRESWRQSCAASSAQGQQQQQQQHRDVFTVEVKKTAVVSDIVRLVLQAARVPTTETDWLDLVEVTTDADRHVSSERVLAADERASAVLQLNKSGANSRHVELRRRRSGRGSICVPRTAPANGNVQYVFQHKAHHRHHKDYPDLCDLPELSEATLLDNLERRFAAGSIYTYVGTILIAVNPFRFYPIYNPKYVRIYQGLRRRSAQPPHIFAIADAAYSTLTARRKDQCIVISGESGSGKTESANLILHHLSALSRRIFYCDAKVEESILGAGPVLEAFGNAKTVHNNNSSRFGRFVQINYWQNGTVHGASIEKYLLEKSRIVKQAPNERNYHVFYYLLAGASASEQELLSLTKPQDYFYLNQNNCYHLDDSDSESIEFARLKQAMETVGFSCDAQSRVFVILSAILHIGNINFQKKSDHAYQDEAVAVENLNELSIVSRLLKVSESTLIDALTKRKNVVGGETVIMSYRNAEALAARDATAKCLYGALFDWIVLQINTTLLSRHGSRPNKGYSIGVLDIFGFEDFGRNGFEQFCINFANEALHFYFNQHIFKFEQEEYRREGIRWADIEWSDNAACLDLFNKKPSGLLYLLDEESTFPGATNETLLAKFNSQHQNNPYYESPPTRQSAFCIKHYAGKIKYYVQDFREKNSDLMQRDIVVLLKNSNFAFLQELIGEDPVAVLRWALIRVFFRACFAFTAAGKQHRKSLSAANLERYGGAARLQVPRRPPLSSDSRKNKLYKPRMRSARLKRIQSLSAGNASNKLALGSRKNKGKPPSISAQFNSSLQRLMDTLNQANPMFVRCIKSNADKAAGKFDIEMVEKQLRYTGMLATVQIRQSGYNYRLTFEDFIFEYNLLLAKRRLSSRSDISAFLNKLNVASDSFQIGMTKIFLREHIKQLLDDQLYEALLQRVIRIQLWIRAKLQRRHYILLRRTIVNLQSYMKGTLARRRLVSRLRQVRQVSACIVIQRAYRIHRQQLREAAARNIQRHLRGHLARVVYRAMKARKLLAEVKASDQPSGELIGAEVSVEMSKPSSDSQWSTSSVTSHISTVTLSTSNSNPPTVTFTISLDTTSRGLSLSPCGAVNMSDKSLSESQQSSSSSLGTSELTQSAGKVDISEGPASKHSEANSSLTLNSGQVCVKLTPPKAADISDGYIVTANKASSPDSEAGTPPRSQAGHHLFQKHVTSTPLDRQQTTVVHVIRTSPSTPQKFDKTEQAPDKHTVTVITQIDAVRPEADGQTRELKTDAVEAVPPHAPIARVESFHETSPESESPPPGTSVIVTRTIDMTEDLSFKPDSQSTSRLDDITTYSNPSRNSPFQIVKKQFKQMITAKDGGCLSPAEPSEGFDSRASRKQKSHWKSKAAKQGPNVDNVINQLPVPPTATGSTWSVSGTSQWQYPTHVIINSPSQQLQFQQFLSGKMAELNHQDSDTDTGSYAVFKHSLKIFYENQVTADRKATSRRYCELMNDFEEIQNAKARADGLEGSFIPLVGINGFRGFLDEFVRKLENKELPEVKIKKPPVKNKKKKLPKENITTQSGHQFVQVQFSIYTVCELCKASISWFIDKGQVCKDCRLTIHKKCCSKLTTPCRGASEQTSEHTSDGSLRVDLIIDRLIREIEKSGLFTVGIYRKPGPAAKVKQLTKQLTSTTVADLLSMDLSQYHVHVLTSVLKSFFREMREPLMTFDLYPDFIAASEISDEKERQRTIFGLIDRLPQSNHSLLERLVFHLTRVAQHEANNCMTPQGLSIIFAPSILRTSQSLSPMESLRHVNKQALCLQNIIEWQIKKIQSALGDIMTLDSKAVTATERLTALRISQRQPVKMTVVMTRTPTHSSDEEADSVLEPIELRKKEMKLLKKIESIQHERELLTENLTALECRMSGSEDDMLSADDLDSAAGEYETTDNDSVISDINDLSSATSDECGQPKVSRALTRHRPHQLQKPNPIQPKTALDIDDVDCAHDSEC